jgi:hypothetical protein
MFIIALLIGIAIGEIFFVEYLVDKIKPSTKLSDKRLIDMEEGTTEPHTVLTVLTNQIYEDMKDVNNTIIRVKTNVCGILTPSIRNQLHVLAENINRI